MIGVKDANDNWRPPQLIDEQRQVIAPVQMLPKSKWSCRLGGEVNGIVSMEGRSPLPGSLKIRLVPVEPDKDNEEVNQHLSTGR